MFMVKHLNHTKRCEVTLSFSSNPGSSLPELGSSDHCPCVSSQEQDVCVCTHTCTNAATTPTGLQFAFSAGERLLSIMVNWTADPQVR